MKLSELIEKLFTKYFYLNNESDIVVLIDTITHGLQGFAISEISDNDTAILSVLNSSGNDKGFYFFRWDINLYKKMWYMITNRYPIIVDIKESSDKLILSVNGRHLLLDGVIKPNTNLSKGSALEIDISSDIISFCVRRGNS